MGVSENYFQLRQEIPSSVAVVIAVKYASLQQIKELIVAGAHDLGFNTWQQLEEIKKQFPVRTHFIGHMQSNKVRKIVESGIDLIQSVDSLLLAEKIAAVAREKGIMQNILLQVKTDQAKGHGFLPEEVQEKAVQLHRSPRLKVLGLMTIPAPIPEQGRQAFQLMKKLFDELQKVLGRKEPLPYLSMGMSEDYLLAVSEGATMVRVGRKVFEER